MSTNNEHDNVPHPQNDSAPETSADETQAPDPAPDPFNPESLRLNQDFGSSVGVKRVVTTVKCRKPNRQEFFRVRPGEDWRLETAAFEDKVFKETYLVDRSMWSEMGDEIVPICLFTAITRQGDTFLWPCKLPKGDGRSNDWYDSALAGAQLAQSHWIRLRAKMEANCYETYQAVSELTEPEWPELSFHELLKLCFKDRFIRSVDHPVLKQLRGEA